MDAQPAESNRPAVSAGGDSLKHVILSADSELKVYLVPDFVAEAFNRLCTDFHRNWQVLQVHPRHWFNEEDFIEYLNEKVCREEKCSFVAALGWDYERKKWPEEYRECPHYNF